MIEDRDRPDQNCGRRVEWGDIRVTLPSITFSSRVDLAYRASAASNSSISDRPRHTTNDVVAWLPEEKVLFAGDLVMSGAAPVSA